MRKSTHTPEYAALRRRLTEMRAAAGKSQRELAAVLKVPHSWVAKVESGERRIDLVEFGLFCIACERSPVTEAGELLGGWSRSGSEGKPRRNRGRS